MGADSIEFGLPITNPKGAYRREETLPHRDPSRTRVGRVIEQFCQANRQILLPLLNLIENASQVVETVIHEIGHRTLEQILVLSAEQVAGARTPGKA